MQEDVKTHLRSKVSPLVLLIVVPVVVVDSRVISDTPTIFTGGTVVTGSIENGCTHEAKFHVLHTLTLGVIGSEVSLSTRVLVGRIHCFITGVGRRDNLSQLHTTTGVAALITTRIAGIRVLRVPARVVITIGGVDGVEESVEVTTNVCVTYLVEGDVLRVDHVHAVLKVDVAL